MTTPPAADSGQALPARVVDHIAALEQAVINRRLGPLIIARRDLVAAIAKAIEQARVEVQQDHCMHLWENDGTCLHCGVPKP